MAVELAVGYISLVPSAKGFSRRLAGELNGPLESAGSDAGHRSSVAFGRTFAAGVGAAATKGAVAFGAGFTLLAGLGVKVAADFEQTTIAFEGILGDADKAADLLGDLRQFANVTPFQFTDLTKSSQQLLAVGFAAEDILPTMGTLGDVAAGLGQGPDAIAATVRALGQMKGKGKASAQELIQISEALPGFSAIGAIAEEMGVTTAAAFELVEDGAVPADAAIGFILDGMANFPGAAGAMERQSKTLNGVISTFKDTLSTTAIDFITPYLPAISRGVSAFGGFIQDTAVPALQDFVDFIADDVAPGVEGLVRVFNEEGLGGVFDRLGELIETNAPIIGEKLLALGGKLVAWVEPQIPPLLEALVGLMGDVGKWVLDPGLRLLGDAVAVLIPAMVEWITKEDGAADQLIDGLGTMLVDLATWVAEDGVDAFLEGGIALGAGLVEGIFQGLREGFELEKQPGAIHIPGTDADIPLPKFKALASGGAARAGVPYIVGEHRPELFVPDVNGTVLPEVPAGWGGGGSLIGSLSVIQMPGEDSVTTAFREARRMALLAS